MYIFLLKYNACTFFINRHQPFYVDWMTYRKAFQRLDIWRKKDITYQCYYVIYRVIIMRGEKELAAVISANMTYCYW